MSFFSQTLKTHYLKEKISLNAWIWEQMLFQMLLKSIEKIKKIFPLLVLGKKLLAG